jgi:hypothetical protein
MIHILTLLTDLLTDDQCMRALAHNFFASGIVNTVAIFLLGTLEALRRWKLQGHPASSRG